MIFGLEVCSYCAVAVDLRSQISIKNQNTRTWEDLSKWCLCVEKNGNGDIHSHRDHDLHVLSGSYGPGWAAFSASKTNFGSRTPSLRNKLLSLREAEVTQLITLCHCVPGCQNISVSLPRVEHDWDNIKSQTFSRRKNKSNIFLPLKQTANLLIFRSVRPPQFKEREFWCLAMLCPMGTKWHFVT